MTRNLSSIEAETDLADVRSVVAVFEGSLQGQRDTRPKQRSSARLLPRLTAAPVAAAFPPPDPWRPPWVHAYPWASPGHHPVLSGATSLEPTRQVFRLSIKKGPLWGIRLVVLQGKMPGATWSENFQKGSLAPATSSIELLVTIFSQGQEVWLVGLLTWSDPACKAEVKC